MDTLNFFSCFIFVRAGCSLKTFEVGAADFKQYAVFVTIILLWDVK
jgi:hypothetical protein